LYNSWDRIVFIDDIADEKMKSGTEVYNFEKFSMTFPFENAKIVIALGEPKYRHELRNRVLARNYTLQTLVHPTALIGTDSHLGNGAIVQYNCVVSCNAILGENTLMLFMSCVGHDSIIGSDTVISRHASLSGSCTVGDRTYISVSVPVKEKISIGSDTIVGMGSVVLRDIPDNVIALGNPARPMKNNESGLVFK
jgi:sugar O-acyltransferase (sialic acid O-acetyltransferase NeuD family)